MEFNVDAHLGKVKRTVERVNHEGELARAVRLERSYDTSPEDLWDAVTKRDRLPRWFLPVTGDLKLGGRYQLEGNAAGTILECDPPTLLFITWEFGGHTSWVEVRFSSESAHRSSFTLTHMLPLIEDDEHWEEYGPGATGMGWELGLIGLALHLQSDGEVGFNETTFGASADGRAYISRSSEEWGRAHIAAGEDSDRAVAAAKRTAAFYTGGAPRED